ncbi:hypothetical protein [Shewanella sp. Isolate11]|uniref:hypothetical protein n=1 Tax=Shewanella sp. Isolate11 TaxID=2908530 RepID=UPI001EFD38D7|nr:hypothetical protein [Shewanella sp. Isolate11]MCG9698368.1 hypothetical protein [Shewanella sp. Isolate11]
MQHQFLQSLQQINHSLSLARLSVEKYQPYLYIPMNYFPGCNNNKTGKLRRMMTIKLVARFGLISPSIIAKLYNIPYRLALEHLNKLVKEQLLCLVVTHRSMDGRVYILDYAGAKYAEELLSIAIYFRSSEPSLRVNQNTVMHDLMMQYLLIKGLHHISKSGDETPLWLSYVTEPEFKRMFKSNDIRNVDAIAIEPDGSVAAVEMEHSFKTKASRQTILLKWLYGLKHGFYDKVMLFSHSLNVLNDIKRLHVELHQEMPQRYDKATKLPVLTEEDVNLLKQNVIYRTVYCSELNDVFYG